MKTAREINEWHAANPGERLDLSYDELIGANLRDANLSNASLRGADLCRANLSNAKLIGADLRGAELSYAELSYADLSYADLCHADLIDAKLSGAKLIGADLSGANLRGAELSNAVLCGVKGIYFLNIFDPRGYVPYAHVEYGEIMIRSGCRYFTIKEAKEHWGQGYEGERYIGDRYLAGLAQLDGDEFREWLDRETERLNKDAAHEQKEA
jgi:hypothetical protein